MRKPSLPVRYCIRENIKELGFGFFKAQWSYVERCRIHKHELSELKTTSRTQTISGLRTILQGLHPIDYSTLSKDCNFCMHDQCLANAQFTEAD